jgi:hypothetical protein
MKQLEWIDEQVKRRLPTSGEWIKLEGLIRKVDGNKLTIDIVCIRLTDHCLFTGSTSGSEFNVPITIDIG